MEDPEPPDPDEVLVDVPVFLSAFFPAVLSEVDASEPVVALPLSEVDPPVSPPSPVLPPGRPEEA